MPRFPDQAETANNRDAEAGMLKPPQVPMTNANGYMVNGQGTPDDTDPMMGPYRASEWLRMTANMKATAEENLNPLRNLWANNYRAGNNLHISGSKYLTDRYRGRSSLHRPKTRTAVKKANAGAANALFATSDIVSVEAGNPLDQKQVASAEINKALLNYRLDRKSGKAGVPWFQIAVGAHNDTLYTGLCISKQYWERREVPTGQMEQVPVMDEATGQPKQAPYINEATGLPELNPQDGSPVMVPVVTMQPKMKIIRDRPMIRLFRPELVLRDPGSDWLDQAQESSYIGLMHAATVGDVEAMTVDPQTKTQNMKFLKVDRPQLIAARIGSATTQVTTARESGGSPQREQLSTGIQEFDRIWLIEWFVRVQGREYVYWTAGSSCLLSEVTPLEKAYPEQGGERPITIGVGNIEPHKIDPMSMVQSVLPLQAEMNDLVNLRMDGVKDSVRPMAFVKRGRNIDVKSIQHRSGDSATYVMDKDDVTFDRPGSVAGEAYTEMNYLNADFDDSVGQFNGGSVTTNRQLNETVGGLQLLNSSANIVGDFDLRVWIETYVEPTLRQVVRLEQYYEDDVTILTIAGEKAKLYQRYGVSMIDDELLNCELSISVNAGIGNADPQVKMDKFMKAGAALGTLLGPEVQARANQDAVIDEVFGAAGFRDASQRYFHPGDQTDPRITKMKEIIGQLQGEIASKDKELQNRVQIKTLENENAIDVKKIDAATTLAQEFIKGIQQKEAAEVQGVHQATIAGMNHANDTRKNQAAIGQKNEAIKAKKAEKESGEAKAADRQGQIFEQTLAKFSDLFVKDLLPVINDNQTQTMDMLTQTLQGLTKAQSAPRMVKKNPDGSYIASQMEQSNG